MKNNKCQACSEYNCAEKVCKNWLEYMNEPMNIADFDLLIDALYPTQEGE